MPDESDRERAERYRREEDDSQHVSRLHGSVQRKREREADRIHEDDEAGRELERVPLPEHTEDIWLGTTGNANSASTAGSAKSQGTSSRPRRRRRPGRREKGMARLGGAELPGGVHLLQDFIDRRLAGEQGCAVQRKRISGFGVDPLLNRIDAVLACLEQA